MQHWREGRDCRKPGGCGRISDVPVSSPVLGPIHRNQDIWLEIRCKLLILIKYLLDKAEYMAVKLLSIHTVIGF